jgi:glutamate racemase
VKSISPYSTRSFYVTIKGKTLEEAIKNYKRDFDKEKFKTVEFVSVVEKNNATQKE